MTLEDLGKRLLRVLDMEIPGTVPDYIKDDRTDAVNAAMQVLWIDIPRSYRDHYTRTKTTLDLVPGVGSYSIPNTQGLLSPVTYASDNKPLHGTANKFEVLNYHHLVGDQCAQATLERPQIYYLERCATVADDSTDLMLYVAPIPKAAETVNLEVEKGAPIFTTEDFCAVSPPKLQLPHAYVESLLLPIASYLLARSHWFTNEEKIALFKEDYDNALRRAGATDPQNLAADATHDSKDA